MFAPSFNLSPVAPVLSARSEPGIITGMGTLYTVNKMHGYSTLVIMSGMGVTLMVTLLIPRTLASIVSIMQSTDFPKFEVAFPLL